MNFEYQKMKMRVWLLVEDSVGNSSICQCEEILIISCGFSEGLVVERFY